MVDKKDIKSMVKHFMFVGPDEKHDLMDGLADYIVNELNKRNWVVIEKDFHPWHEYGMKMNYVTPVFCQMHDGGYDYLDETQRTEMDEGLDPCIETMMIQEGAWQS